MFPWWSPAAKASPIVLNAVRRNLIFLPCNENALDVEWLTQTINLKRNKRIEKLTPVSRYLEATAGQRLWNASCLAVRILHLPLVFKTQLRELTVNRPTGHGAAFGLTVAPFRLRADYIQDEYTLHVWLALNSTRVSLKSAKVRLNAVRLFMVSCSLLWAAVAV